MAAEPDTGDLCVEPAAPATTSSRSKTNIQCPPLHAIHRTAPAPAPAPAEAEEEEEEESRWVPFTISWSHCTCAASPLG